MKLAVVKINIIAAWSIYIKLLTAARPCHKKQSKRQLNPSLIQQVAQEQNRNNYFRSRDNTILETKRKWSIILKRKPINVIFTSLFRK